MKQFKKEVYEEILALLRTLFSITISIVFGALFLRWQFKITEANLAIIIYLPIFVLVAIAYVVVFRDYSKSLEKN
jgi:hypothetical protein